MARTLRTFIAVPIVASAGLQEVHAALAGLSPAVRTTRLAQAHITLRFLGDIDADDVPAVTEALRAAADSTSASAPSQARLHRLGAFPNARRPRVVWVGLDSAGLLEVLAEKLEAALLAAGLPPRDKPFRPHLTLARINARPPQALRDLLAAHAETNFGPTPLDRAILYRSDLSRDGATHTPLAEATIGPSAR